MAQLDINSAEAAIRKLADRIDLVERRTENVNEITAFDASRVLIGLGLGLKAGAGVTISKNANDSLLVIGASGAPAAHNILSSSHGDALVASGIAGDVLIVNAAAKWTRLPAGTAAYVLTMNGGLPSWQPVFVTATGNGLIVTAGVIALGNLTANWTQAGVFDISHAGNLTVLKHAAIGATAVISATQLLALTETFTDPAAAIYAINGTLGKVLTADDTSIIRALSYTVQVNNTGAAGAVNQSGVVSPVRVVASLNNASALGLTVGDVRMLESGAVTVAAGVTLTTLAHLRVTEATGAGTVGTQYGIYLPNMTKGGTNWALYSLGGNSSHLGGFTFGANVAPVELVDVAGNLAIKTDNQLRFYDADNSNYIGLRADAARTTNLVYILPATDPTVGQVLQASAPSAGVVTLSWVTVAGGGNALLDGSIHTDTLAGSVARGDIIVGNATPKWARLAKGAANTVPTSDGTDVAYQYPKFVVSATIEAPGAAENLGIRCMVDGYTLTKVRAVLVGSATPSVTWNLKYATDRSAAATKVWTADKTTTSVTTGDTFTTFDNAAITADAWLWFITTAKSGTVTQIEVTLEYRRT